MTPEVKPKLRPVFQEVFMLVLRPQSARDSQNVGQNIENGLV